jgi:hypothetical protein
VMKTIIFIPKQIYRKHLLDTAVLERGDKILFKKK